MTRTFVCGALCLGLTAACGGAPTSAPPSPLASPQRATTVAPAASLPPTGNVLDWHPFTSRETGFAISLPGPVSVSPCDASGGDCRVFAVRFGARAGFFVRTWSAPDVATDGVETAFDRLRDGWMAAAKEKLVSDSSSTLAGQPCRIFEGAADSPAGTWRIQGRIVFDALHRRMYELSVETPPNDPTANDSTMFFDSLKLLEGSPDAAWQDVASRDAGFSVKMPGPAAMSTCDAKDCHLFRARIGNDAIFNVMAWTTPDKYLSMPPERVLDAARDVWLAGVKATLVSEEHVTIGGQPARGFVARQGAFDVRGLIVDDATHRRLFDLSVLTPTGQPRPRDAAAFLDSFKLLE